ncbi:MAG: class I SAM-dependent rRNA methyltransferase, partial [Bacteroidia bacterium]
MNYKKLLLKSGRERSLLNRHPWVFSGAVKTLPEAQNGDIVEVRTNHNELLGFGFFAPNSQIVCRVFEFTDSYIKIDENFWFKKIQNAFLLRKRLLNFEQTNCYRLLHAEGDFIPGIIVDIYNHVAVVQLLIKGMERISTQLFAGLNQLGFNHIYLKTK